MRDGITVIGVLVIIGVLIVVVLLILGSIDPRFPENLWETSGPSCPYSPKCLEAKFSEVDHSFFETGLGFYRVSD